MMAEPPDASIWHRTPDDEEAPQDEATPDKTAIKN